MINTNGFYTKINTVPRVHWKDVSKYKFYFPEIMNGSSSFVYLAKDGDKEIVIKCYENLWIFDNESIVKNEINFLLQLGQLGLAPALLRKCLRSSNNINLLMELCNCGSLDMYIKKGRPFPQPILREVALFLGDALRQLRELSTVHREINPTHILVSCDELGRASYKLTGLHFCKKINSPDATASSFVGTPEYMAPEVAANGSYSFEADVWSAGLVLYELAAGALSLEADPSLRVKLRAGARPLFPERPGIDSTLQDLICKCLAYDPGKRPTPGEILCHPFITGKDFDVPLTSDIEFTNEEDKVVNTVYYNSVDSMSGMRQPAGDRSKKLMEEHMLKGVELDEDELLEMIKTDFGLFIEYVNQTEDYRIKLKVEEKKTLDEYELGSDRPLNCGSFGEVYLCTSKRSGKKCALKSIKSYKIDDVKKATLFLGEIEVMLELNTSPYSIHIEDYFLYKNDLTLIMEYCDGGDLDTYIRRVKKKTPITLREIQLVAWRIGLALSDMHSRNILHRDVKPANILLLRSGHELMGDVKLCDFGLSKSMARHKDQYTSTILGTFDYFAPELFEMMNMRMQGEVTTMRYNYKVDVWSYGLVLYFMIYKKTCLCTPEARLNVTKTRKIVYPQISDNSLIPALKFIKKALVFEPIRRPNFSELLRDLFFFDFAFPQRSDTDPYFKETLIRRTDSAQIYKCRKRDDSAVYTLKLISGERKRILGELVSLLELEQCGGVERVRGHFCVGEVACLVLEHVKDGDLESYVGEREERGELLSCEEQILIAFLVIKTLQEIHTLNVVHMNLNPQNILLETNTDKSIKRIVVSDFSYSWTATRGTRESLALNGYRSPESVFSRAAQGGDSRADIWSYGMLLYYLIFGVHPDKHPGQNMNDVLKTGELKYNRPRAARSKELFEVLASCVKVNPIARPSSLMLLKSPIFAKYSC